LLDIGRFKLGGKKEKRLTHAVIKEKIIFKPPFLMESARIMSFRLELLSTLAQ